MYYPNNYIDQVDPNLITFNCELEHLDRTLMFWSFNPNFTLNTYIKNFTEIYHSIFDSYFLNILKNKKIVKEFIELDIPKKYKIIYDYEFRRFSSYKSIIFKIEEHINCTHEHINKILTFPVIFQWSFEHSSRQPIINLNIILENECLHYCKYFGFKNAPKSIFKEIDENLGEGLYLVRNLGNYAIDLFKNKFQLYFKEIKDLYIKRFLNF